MGNIFELENDKSFLLYTNRNQILLRQKSGDMIGRSLLLANDFANSLSSFFFNGTLYYAYINEQNSIVIRNSTESKPLFVTNVIENHSCSNPQIILFRKQLFLFYNSQDLQAQTYQVNCLMPLQNQKTFPIPDRFPTLPDIQVIATEELLYFSLYSSFFHRLYCLNSNLQLTELSAASQTDEIRKLRQKLDSATRQYNDLMQVANQYREEAIKWRSKFYKN